MTRSAASTTASSLRSFGRPRGRAAGSASGSRSGAMPIVRRVPDQRPLRRVVGETRTCLYDRGDRSLPLQPAVARVLLHRSAVYAYDSSTLAISDRVARDPGGAPQPATSINGVLQPRQTEPSQPSSKWSHARLASNSARRSRVCCAHSAGGQRARGKRCPFALGVATRRRVRGVVGLVVVALRGAVSRRREVSECWRPHSGRASESRTRGCIETGDGCAREHWTRGVEMTEHGRAVVGVEAGRVNCAADIHHTWAPRVEVAPLRRVGRRRDVTLEHDAVPGSLP